MVVLASMEVIRTASAAPGTEQRRQPFGSRSFRKQSGAWWLLGDPRCTASNGGDRIHDIDDGAPVTRMPGPRTEGNRLPARSMVAGQQRRHPRYRNGMDNRYSVP